MKYPIAPLFVRPWTLNGISPGLIESHYEINYGGTVNRLNAIVEQRDSLDPATTPPEVIHRLKRDEFTALNSMLLHELYFSSIGGDGRAVTAEMTAALTRDFGSVNRWRDEFIGLAGSLASTGCAGWVLLTFVPRDGRLINHVATDDGHAVAGGIPVLAIDMYEHAYHIDFGANCTAYIAAFMRNIDWKTVEQRTRNAANVAAPPKLVQPVTISPRRRRSWTARSGGIPSASMIGSANCPRTTPSSRSASMVFTSVVRLPLRFATKDLTQGTWRAGTPAGGPRKAR